MWRFFLFTPDEKRWEEKAFVAVRKALSLDPDSAEAHLAPGRLLWTPSNNFPHHQAVQEYRRALELDPSLDEARNQLALVYGHVGLLDEAFRELKKALATNPSNTLARFRIGAPYGLSHRLRLRDHERTRAGDEVVGVGGRGRVPVLPVV